MAAKETKTEAAATKKPTTRRAMSRKAAAPEITQEMIAERAYHISQSGEAIGGQPEAPGKSVIDGCRWRENPQGDRRDAATTATIREGNEFGTCNRAGVAGRDPGG